jgi:hypothetical protein
VRFFHRPQKRDTTGPEYFRWPHTFRWLWGC